MSEYLQQEYDFIKRTKIIIEQYESIKVSEKYEFTLLINCFVGILILPQQHWYDNLPDITISEENWGFPPNNITFIKEGEAKSVKNVSRHLRNSISHYHLPHSVMTARKSAWSSLKIIIHVAKRRLSKQLYQ